MRIRTIFAACLLAASWAPIAAAQAGSKATLDEAIPPGANFDKAEFRLWVPPEAGMLRGVVVLVPGSNGDGRAQAEDSTWQAFATKHKLALVGCRFTDRPHDQGFIEEYVNVSRGSGQALLDALNALGKRANHPEIGATPLLLWGMSAGGEFNYEFVSWKPERVIAFVVNKGNIYYTALAPRAARNVPGILFIGEKDLEFRVNAITGLFAINRRGGALWALAEEPGVGHVVGRSRDVAMVLFDDALAMRLGPDGLKPMDEKRGFIGDMKAKTFRAVADSAAPAGPTAWLPTERVARAWKAMLTVTPMDP